jgi:hypothetical protein
VKLIRIAHSGAFLDCNDSPRETRQLQLLWLSRLLVYATGAQAYYAFVVAASHRSSPWLFKSLDYCPAAQRSLLYHIPCSSCSLLPPSTPLASQNDLRSNPFILHKIRAFVLVETIRLNTYRLSRLLLVYERRKLLIRERPTLFQHD